MKTNSMTITCARVAQDIANRFNGTIGKGDLTTLLSEHGVNQDEAAYRSKLVIWGYLLHDGYTYTLSEESTQTATITVTVPRRNAKEFRRHLVERLAAYGDIAEVSEVEL